MEISKSGSALRAFMRQTTKVVKGLGSSTSWRILIGLVALRLFRVQGVRLSAKDLPEAKQSTGSRSMRQIPANAQGKEGIPAIIFQTWKTRSPLPANFAYWSQSFQKLNPHHEWILWDDDDNRDFIASDFPWFLQTYDAYPREIFRADIVRLFFLFRFGGLYSDLDTQCLRPVDDILGGQQIVLGRMGGDTTFKHSVPNAMMASRPGELFWLLAIAIALERFALLGPSVSERLVSPEDFTGPVLLKEAYDFYRSADESAVRARAAAVLSVIDQAFPVRSGRITLLPGDDWYPIDWSNRLHAAFLQQLEITRFIPADWQLRWLLPRSGLVTFWTHSWG